MATPGNEFEELLAEAGRNLLDPPSSVEDLLQLLDKAEIYLSRVDQSPSKSVERALSPCLKALVSEKLLKHSDTDIKVAVASCISEITRISAPEAPYEDDLMKEAFQLIVSSFEHMDDKSSKSFEKRATILATVAKVRSCVVMLDLECDALILQMFQHFLKAIREYHPEHVFTSMETVMTLVIEESEDISPELLSPILSAVNKDNEGVLPIAKKLAEKVLENCASKLNAALSRALSYLGTSVDDYSEVIGLIFRDYNSDKIGADVNAAAEHEVDNEATSPKSEVSSGMKQTAEDDPSTDYVSDKRDENADQRTEMEISGAKIGEKSVESENGEEIKIASNPQKPAGKRGTKPSAVKKTMKPADSDSEDEKERAQPLGNEKDAKSDSEKDAESDSEKNAKSNSEKDAKCDNDKDAENDNGKDAKIDDDKDDMIKDDKDAQIDDDKDARIDDDKDARIDDDKDAQIDDDKDDKSDSDKDAKRGNGKDAKTEVLSLERENQSVGGDLPSDGVEAGVASPPKEEENESMDVSPPLKSAESEKKEGIPEECEGQSYSEKNGHAKDEQNTKDTTSDEDKTPITTKTSRKKNAATDCEETDSVKKSSQMGGTPTVDKDGSSSKLLKQEMGKVSRSKDNADYIKKNAEKEKISSSKLGKKRQRDEDQLDKTPKNNFKGKRTPVKEVGSSAKEHGEDLVGSKVKVWWPDDAEFYEGVVKSFNPVSRKHRIFYNDGDVEILRLKDEKWMLLKDDSSSSEEQEADEEAHESSPDAPSKKLKTLTGKAAKSSGELKKRKMGSPVKGKDGSSKSKVKQREVDEDSDLEKGLERSKTSGSMKKPPVSKTSGSKTPASGTTGSGMNTGSKTEKKRRKVA